MPLYEEMSKNGIEIENDLYDHHEDCTYGKHKA